MFCCVLLATFLGSLDIWAVKIAKIYNICGEFVKIFKQIRILWRLGVSALVVLGEIEIDESYFDAKRVRDKKSRGARNKACIFVSGVALSNCKRERFLKRNEKSIHKLSKTAPPVITADFKNLCKYRKIHDL